MKPVYARVAVMLCFLVACSLSWSGQTSGVQARPERAPVKDQTLSPYFVVLGADTGTDALPLKSTRADVKIAGMVAGVKITQVYKNQGKKALEAIYVFPGSSRAAVHAMRMTVGERVIEAEIMERLKARETYEQAKKEGRTTSLLEQQRPNVFQMNVANILPGDEVKVELQYLELLEPRDKVYEFVLPTVVGPRYSNTPAQGAPDTEKWVQNPYLPEGQGPTYDYGLSVEVNSALPLAKLASPSHDVDVQYSGKNVARVKIKDERTAGNRDFVLRYSLAGDQIDTGLLLYPGKDENFFLLMMEPPAQVKAEAVVPREYIFIVDVSGSMNGYPLEISKALMRDIVSGLRPQDFINVMLFESGNAVLSESGSLPANAANKEKALAFINAQPGGGGTEILPALQRALALPRTPKASRIVVVATDGYVHVEPEAFELIQQNLGEANLFPFGIGTGVNRHLIEGMARVGLGEPFIILNPGEAPKEAARFRQYIDSPVLGKIKVAFEGFQAYDVEPPALPDLFAQRPLTMLGKYRGTPAGTIVVTGQTAQGPFKQQIPVAQGKAGEDHAALRLLWARHRIMRLADMNRLKENDQRIKEVTGLGLKYSLMTQYTSFVAVDKVKRADGQVVTVKQPLPLPEGVSNLAVGGARPPGAPLMMRKSRSFESLMASPMPSPSKDKGEVKPAATKAKLSVQVVQLKGGLDQPAVEKVLHAKLAELTACCEAALKRGRKLPPEILATFTIAKDGRVVGKNPVTTRLDDRALTACLTKILQGLVFPNPGHKIGWLSLKFTVATS
jgi:Ca-activated chloride channel homolog